MKIVTLLLVNGFFLIWLLASIPHHLESIQRIISDVKYTFGSSGYIPVAGDWNGDGRTKVGTFVNGKNWFLDYDGNGFWTGTPDDVSYVFGETGIEAIPIAGDWNGDGKAKIGLFRCGMWYLDLNGNGRWDGEPEDAKYLFGNCTDIPVAGDWDGDGKKEIGLYREGNWYLLLYYQRNSKSKGTITKLISFGQPGDRPITGDWDGDGRTEIGVFREGTWYLDFDGDTTWHPDSDKEFKFGEPNDTPVVGDWNKDGKDEIGVFRKGVWYLDYNGNGLLD